VGRAAGKLLLAALCCAVVAGCDARIPDAESAGGRLYAARCASGCHRLYAPALMKFEMWKITVERMQGELARRGVPTLSPAEERLLLDYLKRHSG